MASSRKKARMSSEVRHIVSKILTQDIKDPRLGFTTVLGVEISDDLKFAKVHVSIMGDEGAIRSSMRCLDNARGFVQHELGENLNSRFVPQIRWIHDRSIEKSLRINEILKRELGTAAPVKEQNDISDVETDDCGEED